MVLYNRRYIHSQLCELRFRHMVIDECSPIIGSVYRLRHGDMVLCRCRLNRKRVCELYYRILVECDCCLQCLCVCELRRWNVVIDQQCDIHQHLCELWSGFMVLKHRGLWK